METIWLNEEAFFAWHDRFKAEGGRIVRVTEFGGMRVDDNEHRVKRYRVCLVAPKRAEPERVTVTVEAGAVAVARVASRFRIERPA